MGDKTRNITADFSVATSIQNKTIDWRHSYASKKAHLIKCPLSVVSSSSELLATPGQRSVTNNEDLPFLVRRSENIFLIFNKEF